MKLSALLLVLLFQPATPTPDPHHFHYVRRVAIPTGEGPVCAALDATTYAHAAEGLNDLRLYSDGNELPYAITVSDTPTPSDPAPILNLGLRGPAGAQSIVFDLQMPARLYSRVDLDLNLHDFVAVAKVSGANLPGESGTLLGSFDLFDFNSDGLARNTSLALAESSFRYLHLEITFLKSHAPQPVNPSVLRGAVVPPSRQAQTLYSTVAQTTQVDRVQRESVATFHLPARVPVERITFDIGDHAPRNFSRTVQVSAKAESDPNAMQEGFAGTISRLNMTQQGEKLQMRAFEVPATLGANAQAPAIVKVAVNNGDDTPVDIRAVNLQMRERKICFDAPPGRTEMFYGDVTLHAPQYDYSRVFNPATPARTATLTAEIPNPAYLPPADTRSLTERHPGILWTALIAVIAILAFVAFRSAKRI